MGNESAPECLNHKDNRNIQVRLDYVLLYKSEIKAKIIRIIETWTNHKYAEWYKATADSKEQERKPPEEDLWVTMSYDQLTMFAYGTAQHDSVKQYVDELVAAGDLRRRPHPEIPYGPPQYLLNRKKVQAGLDALEIPPNLFDLSPLFLSPRKKHTPQEKYPPGRGINPPGVGVSLPPGRGENTHPSNKHTKNYRETTKKEDTRVASPHVDATAPAFSENENDSYRHDHTRAEDAWNCRNWRGAHDGATCADYQAYIDSGAREETPTEPRTPAIKIGEHDGTVHSSIPGTSSRHISHAADLPVVHPLPTTQASQVAIASIPGAATFSPQAASPRQSDSPVDGAAAGGTPGEPRASGEGVTQEKPKRKRRAVTQAPEELSPEVVQFLDAWDRLHKAPLPRTDRMIALAKAGIKAKITEDELKGCRNWLPTTDRPGRPYYRRKGVGLWDVIDKIGEYRSLQDMPEPAPVVDSGPGSILQAQFEAAMYGTTQVHDGERRSDFDIFKGNGPEARKAWREESARMKALGFSPDL